MVRVSVRVGVKVRIRVRVRVRVRGDLHSRGGKIDLRSSCL
jgi:hypothetical protein